MRRPSPAFLALLLAAVFAAAPAAAAAPSDISAPAKRKDIVEEAERLAGQARAEALPAQLKNPFSPPEFAEPDAAEPGSPQAAAQAGQPAARPATEEQVLSSIASWLNPSGTFYWGNEYILLVRQKKLKVGEHLTITFEGRDYDVEVTAVDRSTYSLRLNHTEITRTINPGKSP